MFERVVNMPLAILNVLKKINKKISVTWSVHFTL